MRRTENPMRAVCLLSLKLVFVLPFRLIAKIIHCIRDRRYNVDLTSYPDEDEWIDDADNERDIQDELNKYENLPEIPEMCQIFCVDDNTTIGVEYVSMCPDETAHIRIIGDTSFSKLYKRKVYREKTTLQQRYFKLNSQKYYLDDSRTQPIEPIQSEKGR